MKQGVSDLELETSEVGCETQYEKENQEEPGETKGDTEKLQFGGEDRCYLCVLFVNTNQILPKTAKKKR